MGGDVNIGITSRIWDGPTLGSYQNPIIIEDREGREEAFLQAIIDAGSTPPVTTLGDFMSSLVTVGGIFTFTAESTRYDGFIYYTIPGYSSGGGSGFYLGNSLFTNDFSLTNLTTTSGLNVEIHSTNISFPGLTASNGETNVATTDPGVLESIIHPIYYGDFPTSLDTTIDLPVLTTCSNARFLSGTINLPMLIGTGGTSVFYATEAIDMQSYASSASGSLHLSLIHI